MNQRLNWRSPESEGEKRNLMRAAYGKSRFPAYCYYLLPPEAVLDESTINEIFFPDGHVSFGDKEVWRSSNLISSNGPRRLSGDNGFSESGFCKIFSWKSFVFLRIRHATIEPPPAIMLGSVYCPLIQFGHYSQNRQVGIDGKTPLAINFIERWT